MRIPAHDQGVATFRLAEAAGLSRTEWLRLLGGSCSPVPARTTGPGPGAGSGQPGSCQPRGADDVSQVGPTGPDAESSGLARRPSTVRISAGRVLEAATEAQPPGSRLLFAES